MFKMRIIILNYLDDCALVECKENAQFAYECLFSVLSKYGFEDASEKASPPSEIMVLLGILFNTVTMTVAITEERLLEIQEPLKSWSIYDTSYLKQIQSLLGKLIFLASCVKPGRDIISRQLQWLRSINKVEVKEHTIPEYDVKDLSW